MRRSTSLSYAVSSSLLVSLIGCSSAGKEGPGASVEPGPVASVAQKVSAAGSYVSTSAGDFPLAVSGSVASLVVSANDWPGVKRAAGSLQSDLGKVVGAEPTLDTAGQVPAASEVVLIGTIGKSTLIDQLVTDGKLDVSQVTGKWESFVTAVVDAPVSGVAQALVIAGSDKRGTIFGIYDLSEKIGVSPWYWWADVPPRQSANLFVAAGPHVFGEPGVKYRGIFLNQENFALLPWYTMTYGGQRFGHEFYETVFELLLRMKGNLLWPAMWGKAFNADDPENAPLADEYGIVMGTTHQEPMNRADVEWADAGHSNTEWDYSSNGAAMRSFWQGGIERTYDTGTSEPYETLITVGLRGLEDTAPTAADMAALGTIIDDQRTIIQQVSGEAPTEAPQVWVGYKEVLDFYEQGAFTIPDDVTVVYGDDNWGNVRKLPEPGESRAGGFGMYYHFDYHGGPRNYQWLNTVPIPRIWEQLNLTYACGARQWLVVNVGDLKPLEFPIHFFLDFAYRPEEWTAERMADYPRLWAAEQFGPEHAAEIGEILAKYTKFNGRRKHELLEPATYSVVNYREAETVVEQFNALGERAQSIYDALPTEAKDAFYQLVLHPVLASANLNELYVTAAKNALYARQGRASTNQLAEQVDALFQNDASLKTRYHQVSGGKWNHMMDQVHTGYTSWDAPSADVKPATQQVTLQSAASLGVAIEGSDADWPGGTGQPVLDELTPYYPDETRIIDVYNRGQGSFDFTATSDVPYVTLTPNSGSVSPETRVTVGVDWSAAPLGDSTASITIADSSNSSVVVQLPLKNPEALRPESVDGFVETAGYVSIGPESFSASVGQGDVTWQLIPDLGRTGSAMTPFPPTAPSVGSPGGDSPHLEYRVHLFSTGQVTVRAYLSPTLDFHGQNLRYAVSFDDAAPQTVNMHQGMSDATWETWVKDNINIKTSTHSITAAGEHVLKFWMVDAGVVLQKLVVETRSPKSSYLGPPTRPLLEDGVVVTPATGGAGGAASGGTGGNSSSGGTTSGDTGGAVGAGGSNSGGIGSGDTGGEIGAGGSSSGGSGSTSGGAPAAGGVPGAGGTGSSSTGGAQGMGGSAIATGGSSSGTGGVLLSTGGASQQGCGVGLTACGASCVDLNTSAAHCGNCETACSSGQVCDGGECKAGCSAPLMECSGECVDMTSNAENCGSCGTACAAGQFCSASNCASECSVGLTPCGQSCVDLQTSILDCGMCGSSCSSGQTCTNGQCVGGSADAGSGGNDSGCGCSIPGAPQERSAGALGILLGLMALGRRKTRATLASRREKL